MTLSTKKTFFYLLGILAVLCKNSHANEVGCLAQNIYFEARSESLRGQMAVAFVTLNRVKSDRFPDSFCEVVWQRGQFEWTEDNKPDIPLEIESYEEIKRLSHSFLSNHEYYNDPTRGSLFYHASYVKPCWLPDSELTVKIGVHNFYHVDSKGVSCWNERRLAAR